MKTTSIEPEMRHTPHRGGGAIECIVAGVAVAEVIYELTAGAFDPAGAAGRFRAARGRSPRAFFHAFFKKRMIITGIRSRVRRRGYGTALILELEDVAERLMVVRIVSERSNRDSTRIFSRLGYRITPGEDGWCRAEFLTTWRGQLEVRSREGVIERTHREQKA